MNMHICIVIPSLSAGGAERVVSILANYLIDNNFKISIVCLKNEIAYSMDKRIEIVFPAFEIPRNLLTLYKVINYYRNTINKIKPDVIFSFLEFYNEITMLSLLGIKKKIYLFDRNNPLLKEQNIIQGFLRKYLYPKANGIIVQTQIAYDFIKHNRLNKNIFVLPNPISEIKIEWDPGLNKIITCVGRMENQKNHKYLIEIFSELPNDEWILQFVGNGSLRNELEGFVKTLNLDERVKFLGTRNDIQELLSKSTIFAFPSLWEGFPNALLEAMAVGVPCISNNCKTGPSELIKDGLNGFLVEIDDKEDFKSKLNKLMINRDLREKFSNQGKVIRNTYSEQVITERLLNYILI